ncbi:MAG: hypothetical protein ACI3ZS_06805 [Candidatus Cryptobacteroides sp.]
MKGEAFKTELATAYHDSAEFPVNGSIDRCPLCGISLDENGVCPKCGYCK